MVDVGGGQQADEGSPWWWRDFDEAFYNECWDRFVTWVNWLVEAYAPWVVLPPCWALHEGLATELKIFWNWHDSAITLHANPNDAIRWHQELRGSAKAWKELANCKHEPESMYTSPTSQRRRERAAGFINQAKEFGRGGQNG